MNINFKVTSITETNEDVMLARINSLGVSELLHICKVVKKDGVYYDSHEPKEYQEKKFDKSFIIVLSRGDIGLGHSGPICGYSINRFGIFQTDGVDRVCLSMESMGGFVHRHNGSISDDALSYNNKHMESSTLTLMGTVGSSIRYIIDINTNTIHEFSWSVKEGGCENE